MKKQLLITLLLAGSVYSQSHAMNMGKHAQRVRVFNQIKRACSTQAPRPKSKSSFWKMFFSFFTGSITTHALYETYGVDNEKTKHYCVYKMVSQKLSNQKPNDVPQP